MKIELKKVSLLHLNRILHTTKILYQCGKDMARKYDLHHWDNSYMKTLAIVILGLCGKGYTYLVYQDVPVATFKIHKNGQALHFGKLATLPQYAGAGIGSWCMEYIEKTAEQMGCTAVSLEVYDRSVHAKTFYLHRGYRCCGEVKTRKYTQFKMKKPLK